ncbi:bile acid:sodium symporter family protein [Microvirga aerophila]|uniref:Transporter n=1 Tax=Microvirga aerophila TaxID=670291 RepID=A0A512BPB3_9HYPH|nr:bile acid:sodium symporter [Microvirga aerophila]GEO13717.1 transporter [Microvirga aerophila]
MAELLPSLLDVAVLVFSVTSMLAVGLSYTLREIMDPLRDLRGVLLTHAANFVLVPLLAYAVARLLPLDQSVQVGLMLVATAAGAPFLIKLTQLAKGDTAFGAGVLVLLLVGTIIYMPIVVPFVAPEATVSAASIAMPLILTMLLPLGAGLFIDARLERLADRLRPISNRVSSIALVALVALTFLANFRAILGVFGTGAIAAAVLVIGGAFALGYLLGGVDPREREVIALATAQRNVAAATVVATQSFDDPDVLVMVVVTSIVSLAALFPGAWALGRRQQGQAEGERGSAALREKSPPA